MPSLELQPLRATRDEPFRPKLPGSKSLTLRGLLLAAQRVGTTSVEGALASDDTARLAEALDAFDGVSVSAEEERFVLERDRERLGAPSAELFLGGSATAARFLIAFASASEGATVVTGSARLRQRPMEDALDALARLGVRVDALGEPGRLPVRVHGTCIAAREWSVRADTSSQFASALALLAAQQPAGPIRIVLEGEPVSTPYVDVTLAALEACGVRARRDGPRAVEITPGVPRCEVFRVEPDATALSYFLAAAAATRTTVEVHGLGLRSAQGDVRFARVLERMGCALEAKDDALRLTGGPLRGVDVELREMPDVVPTLAALAALADGPTRIRDVAHLRAKESDRLGAVARELTRLGASVEEGAGSLLVRPTPTLAPARIETYDDHRIAMAFAVLGLVTPLEIADPGCVRKSFPRFWDELERFRRHHEGG